MELTPHAHAGRPPASVSEAGWAAVAAAGGVPLSGFLTAFPDDADDDRAALFGWQRMQEAAAARGSPPTLEYDDDDDDLPAPVSEWALPAVATVVLADGTEVQGLLKGSSTELVSTLALSHPRTHAHAQTLSLSLFFFSNILFLFIFFVVYN